MNDTHRRAAAFAMSALLLLPLVVDSAPAPDSRSTVAWFQKTEQALMDAVTAGDADAWNRVMDERCIVTTEEGEVRDKAAFLKDVRPLPPGLTGSIAVKELTVVEFPAFALVRYLADESEIVFGQGLATKYRVTDTFERTRSTWKMVASHVSVVTANPPQQPVPADGFAALVGRYRLLPDGWTFHVALRGGQLTGGTDPSSLRRLIPLTPTAFVREGTLGEWLFVLGADGRAARIVDFRKFEPLVWTRVPEP